MTKPRSIRLGMFADLVPILDAALAANGGTYCLPSHGAAVHWRQRAYKFRKMYAETYGGASKYDTLTLPRIEPEQSHVVIKVNQPAGVFSPNNPVAVLDEAFDDDLLGAAEAFAKRLTGD